MAGRTFFKCEGCDRMMDCGSHEIGLDEKRREGPGWPLWYGVVDRWWETRRAWRTALGFRPVSKARRILAIAGLPFRLSLLLIHAVAALPLFAAARLMALALRLAIAVAGLGIVAAVAWAAWIRLSG